MYNIKCKVFALQFVPVFFVICIFSVYFTSYTENCTEILQLGGIVGDILWSHHTAKLSIMSVCVCVCVCVRTCVRACVGERGRERSVNWNVCLYFRHEVHSWTLCHHAVGIQVQQVGVSIPVDGVEIPCHQLQPHIQDFLYISCKLLTEVSHIYLILFNNAIGSDYVYNRIMWLLVNRELNGMLREAVMS